MEVWLESPKQGHRFLNGFPDLSQFTDSEFSNEREAAQEKKPCHA